MLVICPIAVNAKESQYMYDNNEAYKIVSSNEKYFKTVYFFSAMTYDTASMNNVLPLTTEISKEEYDLAEDESTVTPLGVSITGQTEYKKLTSKILESSSKYKYQAILEWKKMPVVRSYDIIAIGYNRSVKATNISYETYYCLKNGSCSRKYDYYVNKSDYGVGVSFMLPESNDVTVLKNTLTLNIDKNVNGTTITRQNAVADYSHAVKNISYNLSHSYSVNINGIVLNSDSRSYYDDMNYVEAILKCNW